MTNMELALDEPANKPAAEDHHFDWMNLFCRERYEAPPLWRWYAWTRKEYNTPHEFFLIEGAVCTAKIERGKRKGLDNWKKRDKTTERTFAVALKDLEAFQIEWQTRTGLCFKCKGTGQEWDGWSASSGSRFRACHKCNATGRPS